MCCKKAEADAIGGSSYYIWPCETIGRQIPYLLSHIVGVMWVFYSDRVLEVI